MNESARMIARAEAASSVDPERPIEDRFRAAMKVTHNHWMATDEEDQFQAAIEAVYLSATDDEKARIEEEARSLCDLAALLSGLPIDVERVTVPENPIGLRTLWIEQVRP